MAELLVCVGTSWEKVVTEITGFTEGSGWNRDVKEAYVWNNGASSWQLIWAKSSPLTKAFNPVWTSTYGEDHLENPQYVMTPLTKSLYQGDWDMVGHPQGMQRVYGVMRFDQNAIASDFEGRTKCTSISLRLSCEIAYSGSGMIPSIYSSTFGFTNSRPSDLGNTAPQLGNQSVGSRFNEGATQTLNLPNAVGNGILAGDIKALIAYASGTSEQAKVDYRGSFFDETADTNKLPRLSITADYS